LCRSVRSTFRVIVPLALNTEILTPPSYLLLLDQFTKENLFTINLTSVGQAIAIANLSAILGKLDYSIWLK
ncbi:hypothetical protein, partial [Burkholderia orbicola]|uniref:hypothetical protein n=1 Tax=Burkholderia orbicola TaxID=2978683 RepID=UPI002FDFDFC5